MSLLLATLSFLGAALLFVIKLAGILLLILLVLAVLLLVCPFSADVRWENDVLTVKAGVWRLMFPVFQYPAPPQQPPKGFWGRAGEKLRAWFAEKKRRKAPKKPKQPKPKKQLSPREKAKLTVNLICVMLRSLKQLMRAVFGALRITKIHICLGVRGDDPADAARSYGTLNAWLYTSLGVLDRFVYLDFEELRLVPDFGSAAPSVEDVVSFRVTARALFVAIAAVRILVQLSREKVLDALL